MKAPTKLPVGFYVYVHRRKTDGRVFYVGKGQGPRAWITTRRNAYWNAVAKKHGYVVEIVQANMLEWWALELEMQLILMYGPKEICNLTDGGDGLSGFRMSLETRQLMSNRRRGRPKSPDHIRKIAEANRGKKRTEDVRKAMSDRRSGANHCFYGKTFSEEHRAAISASQVGKKRGPVSESARINMSLAKRGQVVSAEHAAKISVSKKGKPMHPNSVKALLLAITGKPAHNRRKVICVENNLIFDSLKAAASWLKENGKPKASHTAISKNCAGSLPHAYGFHWRYV